MASRSKADLNLTLTHAYDKAAEEYRCKYPNEPQPFITCTYRSNVEQQALYDIGRRIKGKKVTNAGPRQSPHNHNPSFAFDIAFITLQKKLSWDPKLFENFAEIIKSISSSVVWGGDWKTFKDRPHFELNNWKEKIK